MGADDEAAADAVNPDRLLDGEDPATRRLDDADHWTRVYSELLEYKRELLKVTLEAVDAMDRRASHEVEKTDLAVISAEAARFERRLAFWRQRRAGLAGDGGDG